MTLVSIIMSVFNQGAEVGAAIESIRRQTWPHWELWVADDASTDHTGEVLHAFTERDARIRIIRNPRNLGLAASLNRALARSRGQLIARMDADDISLPERLRQQVAFLEVSPAVDVLGGGAVEMDGNGRILMATYRYERHAELVEHMFRKNPFIHPTVMARREFYEVMGGYDERLRRAQDYDLWLRGYRSFRYHNLQIPLIYYRRRLEPRFRDHVASALVLWRAAVREGRRISHGWYALRQLVGFSAWHLGYRKRRGGCQGVVS
jgi:glycosyltransferase involved in cell wall biosynthesis